MKELKSLCIVVVAIISFTKFDVQAAITPLGDPYPTHSWAQGFVDSESVSFNHVEGIYVSGSTFENPGFTGLSAGWTSSYNTPTRIAADGSDLMQLFWTINFNAPSGAAVWDFNVYENKTIEASYRLFYGTAGGANDAGSGWRYDILDLSQAPTPVPEPTTMIAGALLLLPFGASTLRIVRKNRAA
jgi:hypothetical protein